MLVSVWGKTPQTFTAFGGFMTLEQIWNLIVLMLSVTGVTLKIFAITVVIAVPLGLLVALGRMSKIKVISGIVRFYQMIMRGTPLILQLLFVYFGPKYILMAFGVTISYDRFTACVIAFILNYAAYFGEIFRSGIQSIPAGQYEAGKVLGYNKKQTFRHIILPQVVKRVIPNLGSEFMVLLKDTALASVIAVEELFTITNKMVTFYSSVVPFIIAGIFYLVMNALVEQTFTRIEKKMDYYKG